MQVAVYEGSERNKVGVEITFLINPDVVLQHSLVFQHE